MVYYSILKKFSSEEEGAVAIIAAFAVVVIIIAVGIGIDYNRQLNFNNELRDLADAAALQGASYDTKKANKEAISIRGYALSDDEHDANRLAIAKKAFAEGRQKLLERYQGKGYDIYPVDSGSTITINGEEQIITVTSQGKLPATLMSFPSILKGGDGVTLEVGGVYAAGYNKPTPIPAALEFVLDLSGSMGWSTADGYVKIDVLKQAMDELMAAMRDAENQFDNDPTTNTFNTGLVIYYGPGGVPGISELTERLRRGFEHTAQHVSYFYAVGGTRIDLAMDDAKADYNNFLSSSDNTPETRKFLILMTDGVNDIQDAPFTSTSPRLPGGRKPFAFDGYYYWYAGYKDNEIRRANRDVINNCNNLKRQDITIFTIAFDLDNEHPYNYYLDWMKAEGKQMLKDCASSPETYFETKNREQFLQAFRDIADEVSEKIVKLTK